MPSPRTKTRQRRRSPHQTEEENEPEPGDWDAISIFRRKYGIPTFKIDQSRWDKKWEKTLRTLSASKDVFPVLSVHWLGGGSPGFPALFSGMSDVLQETVHRCREAVLYFEDQLEEQSPFITLWLLLDEAERKRQFLNGIKETCEHVSLHYDGRALCPEITTTVMLKQNGKAFTGFARDFVKATKETGADYVYFLPSEWWSSAVDVPEPWPDDVKFAFMQLSLQRNEFISIFIVKTMMSVLNDLFVGSPGVDKAKNLITTDSRAALALAAALAIKRDKPLIRCQNCSKTREEIGGNPKFMVCGNCKCKLEFIVHYCSRACQKADWPSHKKHCGKEKVAKKLTGTIHDRSWQYPNTSDSPFVDSTPEDSVLTTGSGLGTPHPSFPHSPALQRQVALLEHNMDVDYFLFDDTDRPIAVVLNDNYLKINFHQFRSQAMFGPKQFGVESMAELLIKMMADRPRFSRARVLAQFESEYGGNVEAKMAALAAKKADKSSNETFLEAMSAAMRTIEAGGFSGLTS